MTKDRIGTLALGLAFFGLIVAGRLLSHAPNSTPAAGVALFAGFLLARRAAAVGIVVAAMIVTDLFIGFHHVGIMVTVYAALTLPVLLRGVLRTKLSVIRVGLCAVSGSLVFFLTTNLAHWFFMDMYNHTAAGLVACYASALPFLRYTMAGDLAWSGLLFGTYAIVLSVRSVVRTPRHIDAASA